jgi:hypothetical protein
MRSAAVLALLPIAACGFSVSGGVPGDSGEPSDDSSDSTDRLDANADALTDVGTECATPRRWVADFTESPLTVDSDGDGTLDWVVRNSETSTDQLAGDLSDGTWSISKATTILDTRPMINWTGTTTAHLRMRATANSPTSGEVWGVIAWFNVGYGDGDFGAVVVSVTRGGGDQTVRLYTKTSTSQRVALDAPITGLPGGLLDITVEINATLHVARLEVNGMTRMGPFLEFTPTNEDKYATLYAWDTDGEFDSVEIPNCP